MAKRTLCINYKIYKNNRFKIFFQKVLLVLFIHYSKHIFLLQYGVEYKLWTFLYNANQILWTKTWLWSISCELCFVRPTESYEVKLCLAPKLLLALIIFWVFFFLSYGYKVCYLSFFFNLLFTGLCPSCKF